MKLITFLSFLSITAYSFAQNASCWSLLEDKKYSILYPCDWTPSKTGEFGTSFFIFSPLTDSDDVFAENMNLIIQQKKNKDLTFNVLINGSKAQISKSFQDFEMLEDKTLEDTQFKTHCFSYKSTINNRKLIIKQFLIESKNDFFILTFAMEENQENNYAQLASKSMHSFKPRKK